MKCSQRRKSNFIGRYFSFALLEIGSKKGPSREKALYKMNRLQSFAIKKAQKLSSLEKERLVQVAKKILLI